MTWTAPRAFLMRPLFFASIANKRADAVYTGDGQGVFLFPISRGNLGNAVEKMLSGVPVYTTTAVSKARTENNGAVGGLSYLLLGHFRQMLVANVGVVELSVSTDAGFGSDQVWIRIIGFTDVGIAHSESFAIYDSLIIP